MHVETKHSHQRFPFTHPGCTLDFSTDCNRRTHIQAQHQGQRAHCDYPGCTASYCSAVLLRKHVQSVHQSLKRYTCAKCSMSYARKYSLTSHEKVYHQHHRLHCKWPGCKKTFTASCKLYAHVRAQHKARARHKTPDSEAPAPETQRFPCMDPECAASSPPRLTGTSTWTRSIPNSSSVALAVRLTHVQRHTSVKAP